MWLRREGSTRGRGRQGKAESRGLASLLPLSTSEAGDALAMRKSPCCNVYLGALTRFLLVSHNIKSA